MARRGPPPSVRYETSAPRAREFAPAPRTAVDSYVRGLVVSRGSWPPNGVASQARRYLTGPSCGSFALCVIHRSTFAGRCILASWCGSWGCRLLEDQSARRSTSPRIESRTLLWESRAALFSRSLRVGVSALGLSDGKEVVANILANKVPKHETDIAKLWGRHQRPNRQSAIELGTFQIAVPPHHTS